MSESTLAICGDALLKAFFAFCAALIGALISMTIWMIVTLAVAMPGQWFTLNWPSISNTFLVGKHFAFVAILIAVDILIAVIILDDVALRARMTSKWGVGSMTIALIATIALLVVQGPDAEMLTQHTVLVFIALLALFGLVRFITYLTVHPSGNNPAAGGFPGGKRSTATTPISPKFTAIPVTSLRIGDMRP